MDKLTSYLLKLYEQAPPPRPGVASNPRMLNPYMPQVDIAKIKSKANLEKAKCYQMKCRQATSQYDTMYCKYGCIKELAIEALQSIRALMTNCAEAKNPNKCRDYLMSVGKTIQKKIESATEMQERAMELNSKARINKKRGIGVEKNVNPPIG